MQRRTSDNAVLLTDTKNRLSTAEVSDSFVFFLEGANAVAFVFAIRQTVKAKYYKTLIIRLPKYLKKIGINSEVVSLLS